MRSRKTHQKRGSKTRVELHPLLKGVQQALTHDLSSPDLERICAEYARGQLIPTQMGWPPYMFKRVQQIKDFDKRVIWPGDKSFDELSNEALKGFVESQRNFNLPEPLSRRASLVLHHAANICHLVLGEFSYNEWFDSCAYGKRAARGLPRKIAYLDTRCYRSSGLADQHAAFNCILSRDPHLLRAVRSYRRPRKVYEDVKVTSVPKSFKSARIIAPDTILGGFLSRGLGDMLRKRLENGTHIDLALQQERHRRWAQVASRTGHLATIDMSKASDSFVRRHIECIVPKSWHHALEIVRSPVVKVNDQAHTVSSFMLMGSGHTFPLQTILFFCLAEATRTLLRSRGKVSVYGDDIILPTRISTHFIDIMSELGFTINSSKSFYDSPDPCMPSQTFFRESCGGDYKGGVDVRPYMPECDLQSQGQVPRNEYVAWCHKVLNGLLDHWAPEEIPVTVGFLLRELASRTRKLCFVPTWEVDHAGIKHHIPQYLLFGYDCSFMTYKQSVPSYWRLTFSRKKRKRPKKERPYIWYSYKLMRDNDSPRSLPPLYKLLHFEKERELAIKAHDPTDNLEGEPDRSRGGTYRWTNSFKVVKQTKKEKQVQNGNLR